MGRPLRNLDKPHILLGYVVGLGDEPGLHESRISADQAVFTRETTEEALDFATTKIDRLTLLAGAFYYHDLGENAAAFQSHTLYLTSPTSWVQTSIFTGNALDQLASYSYSGYLDATFAVTPKLFVTAGGRYNYDHKTL